ncbi:MAG: hypothetical protein AVO38_09640 [delta proteobacterium ML8_D]|jgi:hypothetical protein|nr:MAG: hypothetical protein AVO38_09640 [delta proteobacterium ML8_D]
MSYELAQKIIAYYGYINPEREDRLYWEDPGNIIFWVPSIPDYGPHTKLTIASAVMDAGLGGIFPMNDGMVPVESGRLDYFDLYASRELFDFDHAEMKGDDLNPTDIKYYQLFDLLEDDLNSLVF